MPGASRTEIEAKFCVPDDATFEKLLSLEELGEYRFLPRGEQEVVDHYLDTPERDLLRGGYACRRRETAAGPAAVIAVKGLGGARGAVHRRAEHEITVPSGAALEAWPAGRPRDIVLRLAGDRPLVELFALRQHRTVRDVRRRSRRVAVLSLDRVLVGAATPQLSHELEIELTPFGSSTDLRALERLLGPFGLRPEPKSKFERALAITDSNHSAAATPELAGEVPVEPQSKPGPEPRHGPKANVESSPEPRPEPEPAPEPDPKPTPGSKPRRTKGKKRRPGVLASDSMAEAGRKVLRFHYEKMLAKEPGTRAGQDPEELHDMRVATRRQRAALRIFEPHYRKKAVRPVRDGLRTLGRLLGAVRDLDVLLAGAQDYQSRLTPADAAALQPLLDVWASRRDGARVEMLAHLDDDAYARFVEAYGRFLDAPGTSARARSDTPRPTLVAHVVPSEIWAHYGAVCAFSTVLPWASVQTLHALRIEAKRLRYLLEFFREALDPCADEEIEILVTLQDHLGELQDANVTMGLIRDFLAGPEPVARPEVAVAAGSYFESRAARLDALRRTVGEPWTRVTSAEFKSTLARTVAAL